jgi:hypothetical protein
MPRPKSEITGSGKSMGMRMSAWEHETYMALGGNKWLRAMIKNQRIAMITESFNPSQENQNALRKQTQTVQERI